MASEPPGMEFDEAARHANIERHGLDFLDADLLFANPHLRGPAGTVGDETRELAVGTIDEVHVTAIFARSGSVIRLISLRKARDAERERCQEVFGD